MKSRHQKLRIAFLVTHPKFRLGGAEKQAQSLARFLAQQGWEITWLTRNNSRKLYHDRLKRDSFIKSDFRIFSMPYNPFFWRLFIPFFWIWLLIRSSPKVIYCRTVVIDLIIALIYKSLVRNTKVIWHCSSDIEVSNNAGEYLKTSSRNLTDRIGVKLVLKLTRLAFRIVDGVITQNQDQQFYFRQLNKSVVLIPNIAIGSSKPYPKKRQISWIGSFENPKRRFPLLMARLARETGLKDVQFYVGGYGKAEVTRELQIQANMLKNFTYLGKMSYSEANRLITESMVYVNTSFAEGFPNTFIQAWQSRTLVISLLVDPNRYCYSKRNLGWCADGSFKKMRELVIKGLRETEDNSKILDFAQSFALNELSLERIGNLFERFLILGS
ncbi:MAG: glycosyltransferase family 4 protein [Candidatus Heimdallarchaeota archaeon]